jgi:methionine sulfoxide reductase heme-binding subunit
VTDFLVSDPSPSWYWYATRGLGLSLLLVLTATVVLGVVTSVRWSERRLPGFVAADLHRNLSLIAVGLLLAHIATTLLDPYAQISLRDAVVPVGAAYRPVWLGLGVVAAEILLAVAASSMLRRRVGPSAWRLIHWTAYAAWPPAVIHGLGTGSDARASWMIAVVASCSMAVLIAVVHRLNRGSSATLPIRAAAATAVGALIAAGAGWAFSGPLSPGWATRAGTPVGGAIAGSGSAHSGPEGFQDPVAGVVVRDPSGYVQISMRDQVDPALTIGVRSPDSGETLPVVTVARDGRVLCTTPATVTTSLYAVCNATRLTISFAGDGAALKAGGPIGGLLTTSGRLD